MLKRRLAALVSAGAGVAVLLTGCSTPATVAGGQPAPVPVGPGRRRDGVPGAGERVDPGLQHRRGVRGHRLGDRARDAQRGPGGGQEVAADPSGEGFVPGDGPDLYGTLTFTVTAAVKAQAHSSTVQVWFESGTRVGNDPKRRIGNLHSGLSRLQRPDSTLRSPAELAGRTFVVMLTSQHGGMKLDDGEYTLAHPLGIAEVLADGTLAFGDGNVWPVMQGSTTTTITLERLKAAVQR